jgi:uncharacterized BrkB/YihY/UPF0761 family membrane protein
MASLKKLADGLAAWWRRAAWPEPARRASPVVAAGRALLRAWVEALRSFEADHLDMRANALTFLTLLSLVPLLAVSFSLFAAFGGLQAGEKALHRLIAHNLAPGTAEAAMEHLRQFAARTSAGAVGGVGVVPRSRACSSIASGMPCPARPHWRSAWCPGSSAVR